jgi:flavin-dependent dehydrogenase
MYDAIIVGARCGGSPTAMLLAREGYRVLLLDKSAFPSDIMSTHYIQVPAVNQMQRWGVLQDVIDAGTPPIERIVFHFNGTEFIPPVDPALDIKVAYCPRRSVLDNVLVHHATNAGAELRENVVVDGLLFEGDRVVGVRAHAKGGAAFEERARMVVGADGQHSLVAREAKAPEYNERPAYTCGYYAYFSGVGIKDALGYLGPDAGMLAFPTNDALTCIGVGAPHDQFHAFRRDIEGEFYRRAEKASPEFAAQIRAGKREGPFIGTADTRNFFRKPWGDGWALVGDAGYHKDFITGLGIMDAFRDAELLADAVDAGFAGRAPLAEALGGYEHKRNEQALPMYEFTCMLASGIDPEALAAGLPQPAPAAAE